MRTPRSGDTWIPTFERWAVPWDRVAFDYLIATYGVFYTPILVAAIVLLGKAVTQRHAGLWLVYAWGLGVMLPHFYARDQNAISDVDRGSCLVLTSGLPARAGQSRRVAGRWPPSRGFWS